MNLRSRIRAALIKGCEHPADRVVADILSGDFHGGPGGEQGVEFCRDCGSYRRVFDAFGRRPRYGDWSGDAR